MLNHLVDAATYYYGTNVSESVEKVKLDTSWNQNFKYNEWGTTTICGIRLEESNQNQTNYPRIYKKKIWTHCRWNMTPMLEFRPRKDGLAKGQYLLFAINAAGKGICG